VRVVVDPDLCQGHTQCNFTAPALFAISDVDGHSIALVDTVPTELEGLAGLAAESCPEQAIQILED
jgi:ferredoxin